jgi:hypothetical protein
MDERLVLSMERIAVQLGRIEWLMVVIVIALIGQIVALVATA